MKTLTILLLFVGYSFGTFNAGSYKVDGTLPIGAPLAGYNYAPRSAPFFPLPDPKEWTTFMSPSVGAYDPTWAKAVVLDDGNERVAFVTIDVIGSDGTLAKIAHGIAASNGFTIPFEKTMFSAAHTHSGPGAISPSFLWSIAPATDLLVPELQYFFANACATAMVEAENALQPALIGTGFANLTGITHNRRAGLSPYVQYDTIDPNLGVIRIDYPDGSPMVTLWNYAIHGICYDSPNMNFTTDVMGAITDWVEDDIGGIVMFWNGDAGDVNPDFNIMCQHGPVWSGGAVAGPHVVKLRDEIETTSNVAIKSYAFNVPFGLTQGNLTLARLDNCTRGGALDICSICMFLDCDANLELGPAWIEETPMFSAFSINLNGDTNVGIVSIPGEAFVETGFKIRKDMADLGFNETFLAGYSNNHMGYFAPPREYDIGGYESLLTFWGIDTEVKVRASIHAAAIRVKP